MLELFPETAVVEDGELTLGGLGTSELASRHGTPLLVYCERTIRSQVQAYREAAPGALVAYGTKAFANVALLRLLAEEGAGADVSTLGELAFARAAGIPGERLVFHGNNKSEVELETALKVGVGRIVADSFAELDRIEALVTRGFAAPAVMVRVTPGVEAHTHEYLETAVDD